MIVRVFAITIGITGGIMHNRGAALGLPCRGIATQGKPVTGIVVSYMGMKYAPSFRFS